jgi:EmrB/QacA subfamily drug resistance transporter
MTTLTTIEHRTPAEVANYDRRWWILGVLGIAQLMVILDSTIVNIALPTAQRDLHFSNADRQWIVTAYSLAFGTLLLLGGRIGDRVGRKRTLIIGLVGFAVASAIGGASVNFSMLVIARTVQGAFGALLAPSVLAILTTTFTDPDERGKAFGIYGAVAGAGGALGLLFGGLLTSYASWRWTLFINLVFAFGAIAGTVLWFKNDQGADNDPFDLPGLLLVGVGLFSLVFGFSHAETTAWSDPFTVAFLVAGVVVLGVFAVLETKTEFPLLPPRVVLNRTRGGSLLVSLCGSVGLFGVFLFLTYYLQGTLGFSPVKTGILFLPLIAAVTITAQVSNRILLPRFGPKPIVPVGLLLSAGALFGLHLVGLHTSYLSHVLPYLLVMGVGSGLSISVAFSTGTLGLAPQDAGVGSATLNTAQMVGGSIGTALLNTLAASAAASYLVGRALDPANVRAAQLHGYTTAFVWCALVFAVTALVAALVLPRGNLNALLAPEDHKALPAPEDQIAPVEPGSGAAPGVQLCRIRIACR